MDIQKLGDSESYSDKVCDESNTSDSKKGKKSSYDRLRYFENRDAHIARVVRYKQENREKINKSTRERNSTRRDAVNARARKNYSKNKKAYRARVNAYLKNNREKSRKWQRKHRKTSIIAIIQGRCRSRVAIALRQQSTRKHERTWKLIGCTARFFREYLESQFTEQMTWENYGKYWVIDHISPVSKFDLTKPWQQHLAFHYSNCRPLEKTANAIKADRVLELHELLDL